MTKTIPIIPVAEVKQHAKLSPSSSARWSICHAAPAREAAVSDGTRSSNEASDNGTVMHDLGEKCLAAGDDTFLSIALGKTAYVEDDGTVTYLLGPDPNRERPTLIDHEFIDYAHSYIDFVRKLAQGGELMVEQRLSIEHITGEPDAKGTSDTVILFDDEICIVDLKGGFKKVFAKSELSGIHFTTAPESLKMAALFKPVFKPNTQLLMYADSALNQFEFFGDFKRVRIIIVMPRLSFIDEHVMEIDEFRTWVEWVKQQADNTRKPDAQAHAGSEQCQYCAAFPCPDADKLALDEAFVDFTNADNPTIRSPKASELGFRKKLVPFLKLYCERIEAQVYSELQAGREVYGWKLVDGDEGDRKWRDEAKAVAALTSAGLTTDDFTTSKVVSPAAIEKLVVKKRATPGKKLTSDQWEVLQALIERAPASLKVVPDADPRPAKVIDPASDFEPEADSSDFFN